MKASTIQAAAHSTLRGIYAVWHGCALRKSERGIPAGTLCDSCNAEIFAGVIDMMDKINGIKEIEPIRPPEKSRPRK